MEDILPLLVLEEKKTLDFEALTLSPERSANRLRVESIVRAWDLVALAKRRTSSAKKRCERGGPFRESLTGFQSPSSIFLII
jgi:hypothetical protein